MSLTLRSPEPPGRTRSRSFRTVALSAALTVASGLLFVDGANPVAVDAAGEGISFIETFDGAPGSPTPWTPTNWDLTVHSRDNDTWTTLLPMQARHGHDCSAPPASHTISSYEDTVFICRNHMMTAINATGYGVIYLTPDHMVDFSQGTATIKMDVSTLRAATRDWWDVWITPYDENLQLAGEDWYPDLNGLPRNGMLVSMFGGTMTATQIRNFAEVQFPNYPYDKVTGNTYTKYDSFLTPDMARRDTFEIQISRTRLKVGMPAVAANPATNTPARAAFWWIDTAIPDLGFDTGVVQIGHHSYNPTKDCGSTNHPAPDGTCSPGTWHWDNVSISPATPFTILRGDQRMVNSSTDNTIGFPSPAPENANLRFVGIGDNLQFSVDGGASWQNPIRQASSRNSPTEHFKSYWTPIPAGTTSVRFRGTRTWAGDWHIRDTTIWAADRTPPVVVPPVANSSELVAINPARLMETRSGESTVDGQYNGIGYRQAGSITELQVTGRAGVPSNAKAVMLNATVTGSGGSGFLTVFPCGISRPNSSNLNFDAGRTVAAGVATKLSSNGRVCLFTNVGAHVIVDVNGFAPSSSTYTSLDPVRLLETRSGVPPTVDGQFTNTGVIRAGGTIELPVGGRGGIPGNARAASLNITATQPSGPGFVTVYPCGSARPNASTVNFSGGQTIANSVVAALGSGGRVCLFSNTTTHLIVDANGFYPSNSGFTAVTPARLLETRTGGNATVDGRYRGIGRRSAGTITSVLASTRGNVPINASAVLVNVTATEPTSGGFITVYPCGIPRPAASSLNIEAGQTASNSVLTKIGTNGTICVFSNVSTHLIVDVTGAVIGAG
jgi:hypothetical protein